MNTLRDPYESVPMRSAPTLRRGPVLPVLRKAAKRQPHGAQKEECHRSAGILVYCAYYRCRHSTEISADVRPQFNPARMGITNPGGLTTGTKKQLIG